MLIYKCGWYSSEFCNYRLQRSHNQVKLVFQLLLLRSHLKEGNILNSIIIDLVQIIIDEDERKIYFVRIDKAQTQVFTFSIVVQNFGMTFGVWQANDLGQDGNDIGAKLMKILMETSSIAAAKPWEDSSSARSLRIRSLADFST